MYDETGNKLQKSYLKDVCDPAPCQSVFTTTGYIGNFVYENGELAMVYHPEDITRPLPPDPDPFDRAQGRLETDFIYDYFIKDYTSSSLSAGLVNVRVALSEQNANNTTKFLTTLEEVHRQMDKNNFDNLNESTDDLPSRYLVKGSVELNERIALLSAANGTEIVPSMVLPVHRGDRVSLRTEYFYSEGDQTETYDNFGLLVNEVLLALASSGAGVLQLSEAQLLDIATGSGNYGQAVSDFMSSNFDTTDVTRPHAYLIWVLYDNTMKLLPQGSGVLRVTDPNDLKSLLQDQISIVEDGYLHAYVANNSAKPLSFDNFLVTHIRGKTRQINHYYPYGLSISGLGGDYDEYLNKYTGKELQTGEFDPAVSTGLEMFDFHARFYDPQLGRWFVPDPAEQFHNPYLAMGNNPVVYVDPDGEIAFMAVVGIFAGVQLLADLISNDGNMNIGEIGMSLGLGALQGVLAAAGPGGLAAYSGCGSGWLTLGSAVAGQINLPIYEGENFSLSISPSLATGTNGVRLGANAFASYRNGDFSISGGYSFGRNFSSWDLSEQMAEAKWSSISSISAGINGSDGGFNYGLTKYGGNYPQTVGRVGFNVGRFAFSHENDFLAPNNQDAHRTGRLNASYQVNDDVALTAGFEVFTGRPNGKLIPSNAKSGFDHGENLALRNGIASLGVQYRGNDYRVGWNSERLRSGQNAWHDFMGSKVGRNIVFGITGFKDYSHHFTRMPYPAAPYTYFGRTNPFTGYGF